MFVQRKLRLEKDLKLQKKKNLKIGQKDQFWKFYEEIKITDLEEKQVG